MTETADRLHQRLTMLSRPPRDAVAGLCPARERQQRRGEARLPVFRFARIIVPSGEAFNCVIKDSSASGARIALEGALNLPEEVVLSVDQSARRFLARVAWRRDNEAGLSFKAELARDADAAALLRPKEAAPRRTAPAGTGNADDIAYCG